MRDFGAYRTAPMVLFNQRPSIIVPTYDRPVRHGTNCRACGTNTAARGGYCVSRPRFCTSRRLMRWLRRCPDAPHMHQSCSICGYRWTTGLETP